MKHKINKYEYGYLKGDKIMWDKWGAAFTVVAKFCRSRGYGSFDMPTQLGKQMMEEYERANTS